MKTIGGSLQTAIEAETTYLCRIWELQLSNGTILYFTDHDQDVVYSGQTYKADPGVTVSALMATTAGGQNATLTVQFKTSYITESMVRRGQLDDAIFVLSAVDWTNTSLGAIPLFTGSLADVEWHDKLMAVITIRAGLAAASNNTAGEFYSRTCRAKLGDSRCQVNLASLSIALTVASVTASGLSFTATAVTGSTTNYFALGVIEWATGDNAGLIDEVQANVTGTGLVTLALQPRFPIQVGDTGTIKPGCNKEAVTCKNKFNNLINMRAEPYAPPPNANLMANWQPPPLAPLVGS